MLSVLPLFIRSFSLAQEVSLSIHLVRILLLYIDSTANTVKFTGGSLIDIKGDQQDHSTNVDNVVEFLHNLPIFCHFLLLKILELI